MRGKEKLPFAYVCNLHKNGKADKKPFALMLKPCTAFRYFETIKKTPNPKPLVKSAQSSPQNGFDVRMDFHGMGGATLVSTSFLTASVIRILSSSLEIMQFEF